MNKSVLPVAEISLSRIGKKFNGRWIFKNIDFQIFKGERISILGNNGSGKSTLLQIIAGYVSPSEGQITWNAPGGKIPAEKIYHHISLASPYLELIEDFTLRENADFFCRMKPLRNGLGTTELIRIAKLEDASDRQLKYFSSGMKQRVKLALAFLANTDVLLLDEPLSNLDKIGYNWYHEMMENYIEGRMLIVCSNNVNEEIQFCKRNINIEHFIGG